MFNKIFRVSSFIFLSIFIATTTLFSEVSPALASKMSNEGNGDNSSVIVIEESSETIDSSKTIAPPDLGDDQAFPFIPGFGKNSGKD